jgi:hypothetical protein
MFGVLILSASVLGATGAPPSADDLKAYKAASAKTASDAKSQIGMALWCEQHGLTAERAGHLAKAVLADPQNSLARGLLGLVAYRGKWDTPDAVGAKVKADEAASAKLAEYNRRRDELTARLNRRPGWAARKEDARGHAALGVWCKANGLEAEAVAQFTSAVVLDPYNEATWKNLGYIKHEGRWMSREQIAADRKEAEAQRQADRYWEPKLRQWRGWLGEKLRRDDAVARLDEVTEPRALPSIVRVFEGPSEANQMVAVRLLSGIDAPPSTHRLAELAVMSDFDGVRTAAARSLEGREPRDFAGTLVEMIHTPIRFSFVPVRGPGSTGRLMIETPRFKMERTYDAPPAFQLSHSFYGYVGYDANGLPVVARGIELRRMANDRPEKAAAQLAAIEERTASMIAQANLKADSSRQQLQADYAFVASYNAEATAMNARIVPLLTTALEAPADLGYDETKWHVWWNDKLGYRYEPPPQVTLAVNVSPQLPPPQVYSCFVAGTPVRTIGGLKPIETLVAGDRVLSQDVVTGALAFQPVRVVHHNPPGSTVRVRLETGDELVASVYHRFWLAGKGWAMARDLKVGDLVRTRSGPVGVAAVVDGPSPPLYNLDVAEFKTFFVGACDALVHDNTLPDPHTPPFDAAPAVAAGGR